MGGHPAALRVPGHKANNCVQEPQGENITEVYRSVCRSNTADIHNTTLLPVVCSRTLRPVFKDAQSNVTHLHKQISVCVLSSHLKCEEIFMGRKQQRQQQTTRDRRTFLTLAILCCPREKLMRFRAGMVKPSATRSK